MRAARQSIPERQAAPPHAAGRQPPGSPLLPLVAFGFAWVAVVALSRILLGAHYLTDTAVGFLIGFLSVYLICNSLFRPRGKKP